MESDDIDNLPMDEHEQFVASEFSNLQKVLKKKHENSNLKPQTIEEPCPTSAPSTLLRDLKIVLASTILFLVVGHPKLDSILAKFKLDSLTLYTIKASTFAFILFVLIHKVC